MSYRLQLDDVLIVGTTIALFIEVPPMIYALLTYKQFEYFSLTGYMPYEEVTIALRSGSVQSILGAPLYSLNMTSGHLFANVYAFTIGPLVASLTLGILTGLIIVKKLRLQSVRGQSGAGKTLGIMAVGLLTTVGASTAGLLGCHGGSGMSGGILAITGLSSTTASRLAWLSPYVQAGLIFALAFYYFLLQRKLRWARTGIPTPVPSAPAKAPNLDSREDVASPLQKIRKIALADLPHSN